MGFDEMPTIAASSYSTSTFDMPGVLGGAEFVAPVLPPGLVRGDALRRINAAALIPHFQPENAAMARRLVQVFIADPDNNIPLDQSLLYSGEQKFTDATDQELFFEVDIKSILAAHNDKRSKVVNKAVKDRTEYLEPAKIRDLKMVVVTVATF
ncbi:hypothetical protein [Bradyrhizobium sp. 150]|uniref:hypothetical protein n=1 Tax=Bradyrhizobium sp. 150 TaxID=2782625 RepID=UPI001FF7BBDF|nr:hypothetical protein [Bradyrhizobium sp. 150]MCK1671068.1 hypothetical protein [Bradyrhizobium sp. 150]